MSVATENPLFKAPWPMRRFLQHFHIVIGLEDQHICWPNTLDNELVGMTEVGQKADVPASSPNEKTDRVLCVVRHHECLDANIANFKTAARRKKPAIYA